MTMVIEDGRTRWAGAGSRSKMRLLGSRRESPAGNGGRGRSLRLRNSRPREVAHSVAKAGIAKKRPYKIVLDNGNKLRQSPPGVMPPGNNTTNRGIPTSGEGEGHGIYLAATYMGRALRREEKKRKSYRIVGGGELGPDKSAVFLCRAVARCTHVAAVAVDVGHHVSAT